MSNRRVPAGDPQEGGASFSYYSALANSRDPRRRPRTPQNDRCLPTPTQRLQPFINPNINRRSRPVPEPRMSLFSQFNCSPNRPSTSGAYYVHVEDNSARVESPPRAYQMRPDGPGSSFRVYDPRDCPPTIPYERPVPQMRERYRSRSPRQPSRRLDFGGMDGMR